MAASLPEWKANLLKQRLAKEEIHKESSTDDKYAGLPGWKRDLLLKKEEEQKKAALESEKPKFVFGGPRPSSSSSDVKLKLAGDSPGKEEPAARKLSLPRTPSKSLLAAAVSASPGSPPTSPAPASESPLSAHVRSRIAAMSTGPGDSPNARGSFSRTGSGGEGARGSFSRNGSASNAVLPAAETSRVRGMVQQLVAENKQESQLRERQQQRRRSDSSLHGSPVAAAPSPGIMRGVSESGIVLGRSPKASILQSPGKRKALTRKISWSDVTAAQPLAVVGPPTYYSESESEDNLPPSATANEDEEEATGLALRVHKSVSERFAKSKDTRKASTESSPPARTDDDDPGALILDESEASLIF